MSDPATGVTVFDRTGLRLAGARTRLDTNGSLQFLGLVARRPDGAPAPVIARAHFSTGNAWVTVEVGDGVALDDIEFSAPSAE